MKQRSEAATLNVADTQPRANLLRVAVPYVVFLFVAGAVLTGGLYAISTHPEITREFSQWLKTAPLLTVPPTPVPMA